MKVNSDDNYVASDVYSIMDRVLEEIYNLQREHKLTQ